MRKPKKSLLLDLKAHQKLSGGSQDPGKGYNFRWKVYLHGYMGSSLLGGGQV